MVRIDNDVLSEFLLITYIGPLIKSLNFVLYKYYKISHFKFKRKLYYLETNHLVLSKVGLNQFANLNI